MLDRDFMLQASLGQRYIIPFTTQNLVCTVNEMSRILSLLKVSKGRCFAYLQKVSIFYLIFLPQSPFVLNMYFSTVHCQVFFPWSWNICLKRSSVTVSRDRCRV